MLPVEVVESFRAGDESAVRAVYDEFGRLVFAVANRILRNRSLAEEASQQAVSSITSRARSPAAISIAVLASAVVSPDHHTKSCSVAGPRLVK